MGRLRGVSRTGMGGPQGEIEGDRRGLSFKHLSNLRTYPGCLLEASQAMTEYIAEVEAQKEKFGILPP